MGLWDWIFGRGKERQATSLAPPPWNAPPLLPPTPPPPPVAKAAPEPPAPPPKPAPPRYGVDAAIALMRALPLDEDPELVLRVVRKTLRSTGVSVEEIIESARQRESSLSNDITEDRAAIEQFERDIADRKAHIEAVAKQLSETTSVRERLQEAVQSESKVGMLMPPEEMKRLQEEAAAARTPSPLSLRPKPSMSTAPKPSAPPVVSKPPAPALKPPRIPSSADLDSSFAIEEPAPSEPTVRKAIDVSGDTPEKP